MITLYTFRPKYCPSCGTPTRLDRSDNLDAGRFEAFHAQTCPICGMMFQKVQKRDAIRAATASEGDLLERLLDKSD